MIELPDETKRGIPRYGLIYSNTDLIVQSNFAQRVKRDVVIRESRVSDRRYVFYKTDSFAHTRLIMDDICKAIIKAASQTKGRVYIERMTGDTNDSARVMLMEMGCDCVYCDGTAQIAEADRLFNIGFTAKELYEYCRKRIIGQDEQLRKAVFLIMEHLEKVASCSPQRAASWVLTAPSGSGKTELFRAVRDFFELHHVPVPVLCEDLSQLTETGYHKIRPRVLLRHCSCLTSSRRKKP